LGSKIITPKRSSQSTDILHIDPELKRRQIKHTKQGKERRNKVEDAAALEMLGEAAQKSENLMPFIIDAVNAYATEKEIWDNFRNFFGTYLDPDSY
jgi:methylmalonyl-CoA mutase, N-terminal domain